MAKQKLSATLDACDDILAHFRDDELGYFSRLPGRGGKFLPYTLDGAQVGAVGQLLWKAKRLERENKELKEMLCELRGDIDRSIEYLDPGR